MTLSKNYEEYLFTAGGRIKCYRCTAQSSRTKMQCKNPALKKSKTHKCKFHGGLSTGPKTKSGIKRIQSAHWKHGNETKAAKAERNKKSLQFLMLEEIGHHVGLFADTATKTRGRKPSGYHKFDLSKSGDLVTALQTFLSLPYDS